VGEATNVPCGETDETPPALQQKLRRLRATGGVRAAPTTRAAVDTAIEGAGQLVVANQIDQALAVLRRAWADRPE
jgi:pilus assembly protein CpaF